MGLLDFLSDTLDAFCGHEKIEVKSVENMWVFDYDDEQGEFLPIMERRYSFNHTYDYSTNTTDGLKRLKERLLCDLRESDIGFSNLTEEGLSVMDNENYLTVITKFKPGEWTQTGKFEMRRNGKVMTGGEIKRLLPKYCNTPFGYLESWSDVTVQWQVDEDDDN